MLVEAAQVLLQLFIIPSLFWSKLLWKVASDWPKIASFKRLYCNNGWLAIMGTAKPGAGGEKRWCTHQKVPTAAAACLYNLVRGHLGQFVVPIDSCFVHFAILNYDCVPPALCLLCGILIHFWQPIFDPSRRGKVGSCICKPVRSTRFVLAKCIFLQTPMRKHWILLRKQLLLIDLEIPMWQEGCVSHGQTYGNALNKRRSRT